MHNRGTQENGIGIPVVNLRMDAGPHDKQQYPSHFKTLVKPSFFLFVFRCSPSAVVVFPDDSDFGARCDGGVSADIARGRSRRVAHCHGKGQKSLEWSTDRTKKILLTTKLSGSIQ